jgi:hypothetical protein
MRYWFRQKKLGCGATPSSWQGWVVSIVSGLLLLLVVVTGPSIRDNALRALWMILGSAMIVVPTTIIAYRKTEGGWRWRNGEDR